MTKEIYIDDNDKVTDLSATYPDENPLDPIARICHEVNRAYCESLGDFSQVSWEEADEELKDSARMGVALHMSGEYGPEASHAHWMENKLKCGWEYGIIKDPIAKTHPCIKPFDQLPQDQRSKDFIFRGVVNCFK